MSTIPAATAAADPPLEPPGTRDGSRGFLAGPYALFSFDEPIANSSMLDFAMINAPAASSLSTAVALYGLTYPPSTNEPHDVGMLVVAMLSFTTIGTPSIGSRSPRWR